MEPQELIHNLNVPFVDSMVHLKTIKSVSCEDSQSSSSWLSQNMLIIGNWTGLKSS